MIRANRRRSSPKPGPEDHRLHCFGRIWITKGRDHFLGRNRIALLEKIDEMGSINTAAKSMNISYKRAWEIVNAIKKVSGREILECRSGGRGGGGSQLTEFAKTLVSLYRSFEDRHRRLLEDMTAEANRSLGISADRTENDSPVSPSAPVEDTSSPSAHLL